MKARLVVDKANEDKIRTRFDRWRQDC